MSSPTRRPPRSTTRTHQRPDRSPTATRATAGWRRAASSGGRRSPCASGTPTSSCPARSRPSSRVMYYRNINTMVRKAAPFLKYDADPYAVILNSQVYWVIDAYTTTDNYPYSQNANTAGLPAGSGLNSSFNYVRNSVKVVDQRLYRQDVLLRGRQLDDPIIQVYEKAFPDLFIPVSKADKHASPASPATSATRRTSSGSRPPCTAATTSPMPADFYSQARGLVGVARSRQRAAVVEQSLPGPDRGRQRPARHRRRWPGWPLSTSWPTRPGRPSRASWRSSPSSRWARRPSDRT